MAIRAITKNDLTGLKKVVDSSGLFPSEYLEEMTTDFFENPETADIWFTKVVEDKVVAIGYCAPEKFTEGTYNLYAIGVLEELQGKGIGHEMMEYIEQVLREKSINILLVETSSDDQFKLTRKFYTDLNYTHEATIRDFWKEGEDKVIFWKKL